MTYEYRLEHFLTMKALNAWGNKGWRIVDCLCDPSWPNAPIKWALLEKVKEDGPKAG